MGASNIIASLNEAIAAAKTLDERERNEVMAACVRLQNAVESPMQQALNMCFEPAKIVAIRLGIDMGFFDTAISMQKEGKKTVTLAQLAAPKEADVDLVDRVMRILVTMDLFQEVERGVYTMSPMAAMYATSSPLAQGAIHIVTHLDLLFQLPEYFEAKGYKSPIDGYDCPFQYSRHTKQHVFEWLPTQPRLQHAFNVTMSLTQEWSKTTWCEIFPVATQIAATTASDVLLVDVGGGVGHKILQLKAGNPTLEGKCIVQDIPAVVEGIKGLPPNVEAMEHDFFAEQPVSGAKMYLLAHILHDWPDLQAEKILKSISAAMGPKSILLVNETVLPEMNVPFIPAVMDLEMMSAFAGLERTEAQYRRLFDACGLQLVKIWYEPVDAKSSGISLGQAVVEARLK